jgi:putative transposase
MQEWLITLRKHRNYCLREREEGWKTNNRERDEPISYAYNAYCDIDTKAEWGACCPLTCPILKHGVLSAELTKNTAETVTEPDGTQTKRKILKWGNASDIQSKRTTQLRHENCWYSRIDSDVLQRNLARLDEAFQGFWQHGRGFPRYVTTSTFKSFEYKPKRCKFEVNRCKGTTHRYSRVYLPGIGWMRYFDSRPIPQMAQTRTVSVIRKADGWYISVLLELAESLPPEQPLESVGSIVGIDVGINKLIALSDGSFVENPRFGTSKRIRRRLRIRQRRVSRKQKGSRNRAKAGRRVGKVHQQVTQKREAYQWQAAKKVVGTADAVAHEQLNVKGMKARCKPKRIKGRFMPNGQSAKRALNRLISDAAWGELFKKIAWLAVKGGKPVVRYIPTNTSRECSVCHYVSASNRDGEKFLCEACGHSDHADTQASRTGLKRVGLVFPRKRLPGDSRKVTPVSHDSAFLGKRHQGRNPISKVIPESGISESIA